MAVTRLPPQNIEAEQWVLGSLLVDPGERVLAQDILTPEMFYREAHRTIYEAMLAVECCEFISVGDELGRRGKLEEIGGESYLSGLLAEVQTSVHLEHYAKVVATHYHLRQLLLVGSLITERVYSDAESVEEVYADVRAALTAAEPSRHDEAIMSWDESTNLAEELRAEREIARTKSDLEAGRLRYPWIDLDKIVGRLREGTITVFAAESGVGKTALAECCAEHWAKQGFHVAFVHPEISEARMVDRRSCRHSGVPMRDIDSGNLTAAQQKDLDEALVEIMSYPGQVTYIYAADWRMSRIVATLEKLHRRKPLHAAIVDYLTIIPFEVSRNDANVAQATDQQVRILKGFADRTGVPCILLSQLNRAENRGLQRSHRFRNTGGLLEQVSTAITFDRPILEEGKLVPAWGIMLKGDGVARHPVAQVSVEKHSDGGPAACNLVFQPNRIRWLDAAKENGSK